MDLTYSIVGADGNTYGPVLLDQISEWSRDGRVLPETNVLRSDLAEWRPASEFEELGFQAVAAPPVVASGHTVAGQTPLRTGAYSDPVLEKRIKMSAGWFYWIVGLSLINTVLAVMHSETRFIVGMAITQIFDVLIAGKLPVVGIIANLLIFGTFIALGIFANKRHAWAFIVGMLIYLGDSMVFILATDWLGIAFHAFVLFSLFVGLRATLQYNRAARRL